MRRFSLLSSILLLFAATFLHAAEPIAEIPFDLPNGFIVIKARYPGSREPLNLLVDSGAGATVLSLKAAKQLHLKLGRGETVRGVGSEAAAFSLPPVQGKAGTATLPPLTLAVDLSNADQLCGRRIDGLVGVEFFRDHVVQIDYSSRTIRVLDGPDASLEGERLPIKYVNGVMCVPVGVDGSSPRLTRLDTGCNDALHWVVPRLAGRQSRRDVSIGFMTDRRDLSLMSVRLGQQSLEEVRTSLHGQPIFPGEAGLLGNGILSRFAVTIDGVHNQLILGPAASGEGR